MKELPIIDAADQQFSTILNNKRCTIRLRYNVTTDRWSFDLAKDDLFVIRGRRIVLGIDMLKPFNLDLGRLYAIAIVPGAAPDRVALPAGNVRLYHVSEEEAVTLEAEFS